MTKQFIGVAEFKFRDNNIIKYDFYKKPNTYKMVQSIEGYGKTEFEGTFEYLNKVMWSDVEDLQALYGEIFDQEINWYSQEHFVKFTVLKSAM